MIAFPAAMTTSASKPLIGILSPGFTMMRLPLATTAMYSFTTLVREIVILNVLAVVHERHDGHALRHRGNAAHVVAIVVRHDHIVDLLNTGGLAGFHDAVRIAAVTLGSRNTGVDKHTLSGGRNQQRCLGSFNIDDIHVERLGRCQGRDHQENDCRSSYESHRPDLSMWSAGRSKASGALPRPASDHRAGVWGGAAFAPLLTRWPAGARMAIQRPRFQKRRSS